MFFLLDAEQRAATAESAVHRAVTDYNQALLNYAFTSGTLLSRYNIQLSEGQWSQHARSNAVRKAKRIEKRGPNQSDIDTCPVSAGAYNQTAAPQSYSSTYDQFSQPAASQPVGTVVETLPATEDESSVEGPEQIYEINEPTQENILEDSLEKGIESLQDPPAPVEDVSRSEFNFAAPSMTAKRYLEQRFKIR